MGKYDSSRTRVAPFFNRLYQQDPTGESWLDALVGTGSRPDAALDIPRGQRLVAGHGIRWGELEVGLPAPQALLEYLVANLDPALVDESGDSGETRDKRLRLAQRDAPAIAEALAAIRSGERGKRWFVLEGESKPDALLESREIVVCIEGKRTEAFCTTATQWMRKRAQLVRHMDSAMYRYPTHRVLGLLIVEGDSKGNPLFPSAHWLRQSAEAYEPDMLTASLPHRNAEERARIAAGILGACTWQAACARLGVDWNSLPDEI